MFNLTKALMGATLAPEEETSDNEESSPKAAEEGEDGGAPLWGGLTTAALGSWGEALVNPNAPAPAPQRDFEQEALYESLESSIQQAETAVTSAVWSAWGTLTEASKEAVAAVKTGVETLDKIQEENLKSGDPRLKQMRESLDLYLGNFPNGTYEQWVKYYLENYESAWDHSATDFVVDGSYYTSDSLHRNLWNERNYQDGIPPEQDSKKGGRIYIKEISDDEEIVFDHESNNQADDTAGPQEIKQGDDANPEESKQGEAERKDPKSDDPKTEDPTKEQQPPPAAVVEGGENKDKQGGAAKDANIDAGKDANVGGNADTIDDLPPSDPDDKNPEEKVEPVPAKTPTSAPTPKLETADSDLDDLLA